ncbi:MAG: hypothetical protein ACPGTP_05085 [Bacteroidia bacterium]
MKNTLTFLSKLTFIFLITAVASSCSDDDTGTPEPQVEVKDYTAVWSGSFEGSDNGLLEMTVKEDNSMTGRGYSTQIKQYFTFSGNLNADGSLDGAESNLKTTFIGQFSDSTASGTWSNVSGSIKGTWSLER